MRKILAILVMLIPTIVLGIVLGIQPSNAGPSYIPRTFIIGPGSSETFFYIYDKSRPPNKLWICGYIHDFTKNAFGGYDPHLSCWPYG